MRLLEDYLRNQDLESIDKVLASDTSRFDILVSLSGLDPQCDFRFSDLRRLNFCGADLRGFNFTGSDLRQSVRNGNTLIDETTILEDALIEWVEIDALPIVMKMQEVEAASGSKKRQELLNQLTTEFGRTTHVVTYMTSAASRTKTLEDFLDFALFLPQELSESQAASLRSTAQRLLRKKLAQSRNRTRRDKTTIFAIEGISERLRNSPDSLAERIYSHLANIVNSKQQTTALKGIAVLDQKDMEDAFRLIGS